VIIDDLDLRGHDPSLEDRTEKEADDIARDGLIPKKVRAKIPLKEKAGNIKRNLFNFCILLKGRYMRF